MTNEIVARISDLDGRDPDHLFKFFKVSQPGHPEHSYVDSLENVIEMLKSFDGDEESVTITSTYMSVKDYNALPEFDGF